jgi:hypothetical protein
MKREDLVEWLEVNGCHPEPIEGLNITGWSVKFVNPKTNRYAYVKTPIDDTDVTDYIVCHTCDQLMIHYPDCVAEQAPIVNHLKERFRKNR